MNKEYVLKHKNNNVLLFEMDNKTYNILDIKKIFQKERLPFGLIYGNNLMQCGIQLEAWIKGRGIADSRIVNIVKDRVNIFEKTINKKS